MRLKGLSLGYLSQSSILKSNNLRATKHHDCPTSPLTPPRSLPFPSPVVLFRLDMAVEAI